MSLVLVRRLRVAVLVLATAALAWSGSAAAAGEIEAGLQPGGEGKVVEVVDGDTVVLDDGRQVRLVGLQAPKLPLGRTGFAAWPLADAARRALVDLAAGKTVRLAYGGARMDRHRRALAHLFVDADTWVQGEMLSRGMARVYTFPDNRALADAMLEREAAARRAQRGIWADPFYRIRTAEAVARDVDTFQVVEDRVHRAARVRDRVYLNFAEDWRRDFTVAIAARDLRAFAAAGLDPLALGGARIRVRGWIQSWNGPLIEATHPEQIEVVVPGP